MKNFEGIEQGKDETKEEFSAKNYEEGLDKVDTQDVYGVEDKIGDFLANLTWRFDGDSSPREKYERSPRQHKIDKLRLFSEAEILHDYTFGDDVPDSKFFRHLVERCKDDSFHIREGANRHGDGISKIFADRSNIEEPFQKLEDDEITHFNEAAENFTRYISTENNKERSFTNYIISLIRMCEAVFGRDSRAEMYLCDDLNQLLAPHEDDIGNPVDNKSKIIDRLIERKLNAVQKIAMGKTKTTGGQITIGFTGVLDLPEGIENRSIKELLEEGVPSLYGYNEDLSLRGHEE